MRSKVTSESSALPVAAAIGRRGAAAIWLSSGTVSASGSSTSTYFCKRMDELLLEVVRGDRLVGDLAQRDDGVLVAVAVDRQRRAGRDQAGAVACEQHELEAVLDLVDAIFDGHASHARLLPGCFGGGGKRAMYTQTGAETTLSGHHGRRWMAAPSSWKRVGTRPWKPFHGEALPSTGAAPRLDLPCRLSRTGFLSRWRSIVSGAPDEIRRARWLASSTSSNRFST